MKLAGLDIGTTACKMTIFTDRGERIDSVSTRYPIVRTQSEHELDAAAVWQAVQSVIEKIAPRHPDLAGIGVTSFGETFVLLDEWDNPLCPAMLYTDPRGQEQCEQLLQKMGDKAIYEIAGVSAHSMYSLPKLMWLRDNRADLLTRGRRVLLMADYIVYLLSGRAQIDYSLAARTMAFNVHTGKWSRSIFQAADIDMKLFPDPVPIGTPAWTIRKNLARRFGFQENLLIVTASHDQVAAAVGSGVFEPGWAVDGAGTVECITPVFETCDFDKMASGHYAIIPYLKANHFVCYAFIYSGGALVSWVIDRLTGCMTHDASKGSPDLYHRLAEKWSGVPTGLLVLPHFAGAATPYMDTESRGAIVGLTLANTAEDIYLAAMEGICFEMRLNLERLCEAGVAVRQLRATGGGAKNRVWLQMKADILNMPVTLLQTSEAGTTGCAMMTGVALGAFSNLREAADHMVVEQETVYPRSDVYQRYSTVYERYKGLYKAVRPLV